MASTYETYTEKPTIEIPDDNFQNFETTLDGIKINDHLSIHKIIGIGFQGAVYTTSFNKKNVGKYPTIVYYDDEACETLLPSSPVVVKVTAVEPNIQMYMALRNLKISPILYCIFTKKEKDVTKYYLVFEKMQRIIHHREINTEYFITQLKQACLSLIEAGIFHNDLRCDNIMVDRNLRVKIIDFESAYFICHNNLEKFDTFFYEKCVLINSYIYNNEKKYKLPYNFKEMDRIMDARGKHILQLSKI